jgi:hypothetical protein
VAPGYHPFERPISLARDVNVIFGLRPITARVPRAQKPADNSARRPTPWGDMKEIEPADLKRIDAPRSSPKIDQQNPYAP